MPFDTHLQTGSEDLPLDHLPKQGGLYEPEQIHLAFAGVALFSFLYSQLGSPLLLWFWLLCVCGSSRVWPHKQIPACFLFYAIAPWHEVKSIGMPEAYKHNFPLAEGKRPLAKDRRSRSWKFMAIHFLCSLMIYVAGSDSVFVSWATHNATVVPSRAQAESPDLDSIASQAGFHHDPSS